MKEKDTPYALAECDIAYSDDGDIAVWEGRRLHRGEDGLLNPSDNDEPEVFIGDDEGLTRLSQSDATAFAFAILEAAGVEVEETVEEMGEKYITRRTFAIKPVSLITVDVSAEAVGIDAASEEGRLLDAASFEVTATREDV